MKKVVSLLAVLALCVSIFVGCSSKEVNLADVMSKFNADFSVSATQLSTVDDLDKYYSITTADVKQFAAEINSDTSAYTEIVLVEAVDSNAADNVEAALLSYYNSVITQVGAYDAEMLEVIKQCKVTKDGNFVTMIISENASDMLEIFCSYIN